MLFNNGGKGKRQQNGIPFLNNSDLSTTPKPAKILAVKEDAEAKFGPGLVLKLALDGKVIRWTVRRKNPNFDILMDKFGPEENDWAGSSILLNLEQDEFSESYFPHVSFPSAKEAKGAK